MPSMMRRLTSAPKPSWRVRVYMSSRSSASSARAGRSARRRSARGSRRPRRARARSRPTARAGVRQRDLAGPRAELLARARAPPGRPRARPASMPSPVSSSGTPEADAVEALGARAARSRSGNSSEVASHGSRPTMWREQQRRVGDVARERPGLVERGGERDHAVARDGAVGRFQPDDPAQRGRLADRAARCRCRAPTARGRRRRRRRCRPRSRPGTRARSHGLRTGPKAEFSLEEPIANSSWLVFAEQRSRPASARRATTRGGVRRQVALEDARARLAGHALGAEQVLDRQRHAAERRRGRAAGASSAPPR